MWIAKFTIRHDCILGNRCAKFSIALQGVNFTTFKSGRETYTSSMHLMIGSQKSMESFIADLRKDPCSIKLERKKDTFFLLEKSKVKAVGFHTPRIIFVKPVLISYEGVETWEVASWERSELTRFIGKIKKAMPEFKLLKIVQTPIDDVFFPRLMPALTKAQRRALELAVEHGYFTNPRRTHMRNLANMMQISLATYQEHLRKAEEKLLPSTLAYTKA